MDYRSGPDISESAKLNPGVDYAPTGAVLTITGIIDGQWLRTNEGKWLPVAVEGYGILMERMKGVTAKEQEMERQRVAAEKKRLEDLAKAQARMEMVKRLNAQREQRELEEAAEKIKEDARMALEG